MQHYKQEGGNCDFSAFFKFKFQIFISELVSCAALCLNKYSEENENMHKNLRSFIEVLRRENELIEIEAEVDPYLELAEIHRRVIEEQGKALLFKKIKKSTFPVVTN